MPAEPASRRIGDDDKKEEPKRQQSAEERIAALEAALAASRGAAPLNPIPEHGAGEGTEIAQTWSLYEQERSIAAESKPPGRP